LFDLYLEEDWHFLEKKVQILSKVAFSEKC